jgi:hypothetical protein
VGLSPPCAPRVGGIRCGNQKAQIEESASFRSALLALSLSSGIPSRPSTFWRPSALLCYAHITTRYMCKRVVYKERKNKPCGTAPMLFLSRCRGGDWVRLGMTGLLATGVPYFLLYPVLIHVPFP